MNRESTRLPAPIRALLACPQCRGALSDRADGGALECPICRLSYPLRDGIPVLLAEAATAITP